MDLRQDDIVIIGAKMNSTQCRMARAGLGLSVDDLAELSGLSGRSIIRFENGDRVRQESVAAISKALIGAGASFIEMGCRSGALIDDCG